MGCDPIAQVTDRQLEKGLVNRVFHRDVDSAFRCLKQVAGSANLALSSIHEQTQELYRYRRNDVNQHNKTVEAVDIHTRRLDAVESRTTSLEALRLADLNSARQTVNVVDAHSRQINALQLETGTLNGRVAALEIQRVNDRAAEAKTVATVDQHTKQLVDMMGRMASLEVFPAKITSAHSVVQKRVDELEKQLEQRDQSYKTLRVLFEEVTLSYKEMAAKVGGLIQTREDLTAKLICLQKDHDALDRVQKSEMAEMAKCVKALVADVSALSSWKEAAASQQQKQGDILKRSHQLQVALAEVLASMGQEQRYLFHMTKVVDTKLGLLLEKKGIPAPKIELPEGDPAAPFREILMSIKEIREMFAR